MSVSESEVRANFQRYGLLDDQARFLPGWFKDTLQDAPIDRMAASRLEGDLYESTMQALDALYPRLPCGGCCIVDDYLAVKGASNLSPPTARNLEYPRRSSTSMGPACFGASNEGTGIKR